MNGGLELWKHGADVVYGVNDVGAGLAEDVHQNCRIVIEKSGVANILDRVDSAADVGDTHRGSVMVSDNQRLIVGGLEQLVVGAHLPHPPPIGKMAFRSVGVRAGQNSADILETDSIFGKSRGIQFDADPGQRAAAYMHLADAFELRQFLRDDRRARVVHGAAVEHLGRNRDHEDRRIGRIHFAVGGIIRQVRGQVPASGVDGGLYIARRGVDVAVEIELERDAGLTKIAGGSHLRDGGDAAELALPSGVATADAIVSGLAPGNVA